MAEAVYPMSFRGFLLTLMLSGPMAGTAQHAHINAGALSTAQNAPLYFVNGDGFVRDSGYVVTLTHTNAGRFAGLHQGSITFTALPATPNNGGPAFGHAAPGSFIELELQSASGPAGGRFDFWEPGDTAPRIALAVGADDGTNRFALSESNGSPGSDPFGHAHGRVFTATTPGLYSIKVRLVDSSANGAGGGPIHAPSEPFHLLFQAGLTISSLQVEANNAAATFGTSAGNTYYLERSQQLTSPDWITQAGPAVGNNHLQTLIDPNATNAQAVYRLRRSTP